MTNRKDVFYKLIETKKLPSPSKTALEVMRLCQNETASLGEIAKVIQTDPSLSAELLKYANAAFWATGIQVVSIQEATVKLGMKTVVNLALCFSLISTNKNGQCQEFDYEKFWSTSLAQAIATKIIASVSKKMTRKSFLLQLYFPIWVSWHWASLYPREYAVILNNKPSNELSKNLEKVQFGIDSAELTTELFLDWGTSCPLCPCSRIS